MVKLEGTIRRFIGLSTDSKPTAGLQLDGTTVPTSDLLPGSSFLETDTGRIARYDGSQWLYSRTEADVISTLAALIEAVNAGTVATNESNTLLTEIRDKL